jgi:hypothetical protein
LDLMQLLQVGLPSSHLIRRRRHARKYTVSTAGPAGDGHLGAREHGPTHSDIRFLSSSSLSLFLAAVMADLLCYQT